MEFNKCVSKGNTLPYNTVSNVGILCQYSAHNSPNLGIFIDLHDVGRHGKEWRFINIPNNDLQHGGIFKGTQVRKAKIKMCICSFYVECIWILFLKIQWLLKRKKKMYNITTAITLTHFFCSLYNNNLSLFISNTSLLGHRDSRGGELMSCTHWFLVDS